MSDSFCICREPLPLTVGVGRVVCQGCNNPVRAKKKGEGGANCARISDEEKKLGVWLIKQHQRMIHEIRQKFGIQE